MYSIKTNNNYVWPVRAGGNVPAELPETGQTTCYDTSANVISCSGSGQDGELKKGVSWPSPRFTNPDGSTPFSGSVVLDQLSRLMWTQDGNAPGPAPCSPGGLYEWQEALDYIICLNTNNYLGYTDWRLPNINELESLINAEKGDNATWLNGLGFTNVQASNYYSSSTNPYFPSGALVIGFPQGAVLMAAKSGGGIYVWPVRGGR
jgi:hypothetical protein